LASVKSLAEAFSGGPHGDGGLPSPYQQATESIRAAARWLLAAFAGVGGVLVAGVPLTDIGRIGVWTFRFWLAVGAIVVALAAIGLMIRAVSKVFTARYVSFGELGQADFPDKSGRKRRVWDVEQVINFSRDELYGAQAGTLAELAKRLRVANETSRAVGKPSLGKASPSERGVPTALAELERASSRVLDFANYEYTRRTFQSLFPRLALGGIIAAGGVGVYAIVVGSAPARAPKIERPLPVTLTLNPEARDWNRLLGEDCDISAVKAVAVGGSLVVPEVVTASTQGCRAARFKVGKKQGIAVPVVQRSTSP